MGPGRAVQALTAGLSSMCSALTLGSPSRRRSRSGPILLMALFRNTALTLYVGDDDGPQARPRVKALSIRQPFAELILRGLKDVENRTWFTKYSGLLLIHASGAAGEDSCATYGPGDDLPRGELVGIVNLVRCTRRRTSPSHVNGRWSWYLASPRRFRRRIRFKARVGLMEVPNRLVASAVRTATAERVRPLDAAPGNAAPPKPLRLFSWGYKGWGNATRQLIRAVDLAEACRGFAPPVFVDVRYSRKVRAIGFKERAFERLLGHERYRWMPSLGNPQLRNPRASRVVDCPSAAHPLLDLALDAARQRRRVIFFCSCPSPGRKCHRNEVAKHVIRVARLRDLAVVVQEWPGDRPWGSPVPVRVTKSTIAAVRSGRRSVPLPLGTPLQSFAGQPWGTVIELRAGLDRQLLSAGPARFERRQWVLPVFLGPVQTDAKQRELLRKAARERRKVRLDERRTYSPSGGHDER